MSGIAEVLLDARLFGVRLGRQTVPLSPERLPKSWRNDLRGATKASNADGRTRLVVTSSAVKADNPEGHRKPTRTRFPVIPRRAGDARGADALEVWNRRLPERTAKTTTTSMVRLGFWRRRILTPRLSSVEESIRPARPLGSAKGEYFCSRSGRERPQFP